MPNVSVNDVIQVNDAFKNSKWTGCLMIVDEVRDWGVQAYLHVPMQGDAYLRLRHNEYEVIGKAAFVRKPSEE